MSSFLSNDDIDTLERQIEQLYDYNPIPEHEVKALCEKVRLHYDVLANILFLIIRPKKSSLKKQMFNQ